MNYEKVLARTVQELKPSGIRKFFAIAEEMKDVISLGVGEPDFKTPWPVRRAAIRSLENGKTWYTANAGLAALKKEISVYLKRRLELDYSPVDELMVTVGGSEAIDMCIRALVNPGDEVLSLSRALSAIRRLRR
jgi:aminotransferase